MTDSTAIKKSKKPLITVKDDDLEDLDALIAEEQQKPKPKITIKEGGKFIGESSENDTVQIEGALKIRIEYDEKAIVDMDTEKLLEIPTEPDLASITKILAESPQLQARWGVVANEVQYLYDREKLCFEVWMAERREFYRKHTANIQKATESKILDLVAKEPEYIQRLKIINKLKRDASTAKSIAIAFGVRADKAVTIAHLLRKEMDTISKVI